MSLAQKTESAPAKLEMVPSPATPRSSTSARPIDFRALARRPAAERPPVVELKPAAAPAAAAETVAPLALVAAPPPQTRPEPNSAVAFDLLAEVSSALSVLMARCQDLEGQLVTTRSAAKTAVDEMSAALLQSRQGSEAMTDRITQQERTIADLRHRLTAADERNVTLRAMAEKTQHAAAEAECLSALFQDKVIATFGVGSAGHSILQALRDGSQAMPSA